MAKYFHFHKLIHPYLWGLLEGITILPLQQILSPVFLEVGKGLHPGTQQDHTLITLRVTERVLVKVKIRRLETIRCLKNSIK